MSHAQAERLFLAQQKLAKKGPGGKVKAVEPSGSSNWGSKHNPNPMLTANVKAVIMKSGDCFVFGNKNRMIFHGVESINANTSPPDLRISRPGRVVMVLK
jgi:hypothetical protein